MNAIQTERVCGSSLEEHQAALKILLEAFADVCQEYDIPYLLYAGTMLGAVRHQGFIPWDDDVDVIMPREGYERFLKIAPEALDAEKFFVQGEYSDHWPMFFSKLRLNDTACMEKYIPKDSNMHQGIYIDIFPYDNLSDSRIERWIQFFASKLVIAAGLQKRGHATGNKWKKLAMKMGGLFPVPLVHAVHTYVQKRGKNYTQCVHTFFAAASAYHKNVFPRAWLEETAMMPFEGRDYPVSAYYDQMLTTVYGDYLTLPSEENRKCKQHNFLVDVHHSYMEYLGYQENQKIEVYYESIR